MTQHLDALAQANRIKDARAAIRRNIAAQPRPEALRLVASLLRECRSAPFGAFTVAGLLTSCPRVGPHAARRTLNGLGLTEGRRVRDLTERQRGALADACVWVADGRPETITTTFGRTLDVPR